MKLYIGIENNDIRQMPDDNPISCIYMTLSNGTSICVTLNVTESEIMNDKLRICCHDVSFAEIVQADSGRPDEIPIELELSQFIGARVDLFSIQSGDDIPMHAWLLVQYLIFEQEDCGVCIFDSERGIGDAVSLTW